MPMRTQLDLKFATRQIQTLWKETVGLAEGRYIPKFGLTEEAPHTLFRNKLI